VSPPPFESAPRAAERGPRRALFDVWSHVYDFPLVQWATYRPVHDAVVGALRRRAPRALLDLGCGTGLLLQRLARELPADLVGCDYSAGMLAHAAARLDEGAVALVRGDAQRLPFRDRSFDALVSTEAFHCFPDQDGALAEMARVLVPGGTLVLGFVNPPLGVVGELVHVGSRLLGMPLRWPTAAALRRRVEAAGFDVVSQRRIFRIPGFLVPPVLTEARRR
jgi:ubiquinone/menaquinone biosynthesis C-methylase UbiE